MTAIDQFLELGGDEVINRARTVTYIANGVRPSRFELAEDCGACVGLAGVLGHDPYTLPDVDDAPWYDPAFPESADFAGLLVESADLSAPVNGRALTQQATSGAVLSRLRHAGRTLTVTGLLVGRTCCATGYGLRWLQAALEGPCLGGVNCGGRDACFLTCCPSLDPPGLEYCDPETGQPVDYDGRDCEQTEYQRGADFFRTVRQAGIIDGVEVTDRFGAGGSCGCNEIVRVEFTVGIGDPYLYDSPTLHIDDEAPPPCEGPILPCQAPNLLSCEQPEPCATDPLCPPPPPPPAPPLIGSECVCIPQTTSRVIADIEAPAGGNWFDATTIVDVVVGNRPIRHLQVKMWANPLRLDPDDLDPCFACSTLFVSYLPAGSTLRVDGMTKRNTITCGQSTADASPNLFTVEGRPFRSLDLSCDPAVIAVEFDCAYPSPGMHVSVSTVRRALW